MTVKDLRESLEDEPDDAIVMVGGMINGNYVSRSIYKTAMAADDSCIYLYIGGKLKFDNEED